MNIYRGPEGDERIWFEAASVCWQMAPQATIFADLGEAQPVGQVVARFLGGGEQGGLTFPDEIRVLASNDGENYYLVTARHKAGPEDLSSDAYHLPEVGQAWVQNFILPVGVKTQVDCRQNAFKSCDKMPTKCRQIAGQIAVHCEHSRIFSI